MIRMIRMTKRARAAAALALSIVACGLSVAQTFPTKPIRIIVPFPPGGPTDMIARAVGQKLQEHWGQPVLVENRPGGSTIIGVDMVVKSPPDGHTLLLGSNSLALNRYLVAKVPYDVDRDIAPIILIAKISNALVVHPSFPANNYQEFVAYAKANPGKITYGSTGQGTATHLFAELFSNMAGVQLVHVPYKGTGPAVIDLVGGQINAMFDSLSTVIPNAKAGKVRLIGLTNSRRSAAAPEMPTLHELGLTGYEATGWFGIAGPAKVPAEILIRLNREIDRIIHLPDMAARLGQIGSDVVGGPPEDFRTFIQAEAQKWGKVIRDANIKPE